MADDDEPDWSELDDVAPRMEEEEDASLPREMLQEQAAQDPEAAEEIKSLRPRMDLTEDKVDWVKAEKEDRQLAQDIAEQRQWDIDRFYDKDFCAVCSLRHQARKEQQQQQQQKVMCLSECNAAVMDMYEKCAMLQMLTAVRDLYIRGQIERLPAREERLVGGMEQIKYWSRRAIYEHLHSHNVTDYVRLVQDLRRNAKLQTEAYRSIQVQDMLTGVRHLDIKMGGFYTKMMAVGNGLRAELDKKRRAGGVEFF